MKLVEWFLTKIGRPSIYMQAPDLKAYGRNAAAMMPYVRKITSTIHNFNGSGFDHVTLECGHWALDRPGLYPGPKKVCQECIVAANTKEEPR